MNAILTIINAAACLALFWVAGTFMLAGSDSPSGRPRVMLRAFLLLAMALAFVLALAPLAGAQLPSTPQLIGRVFLAVLAAVHFSRAFGLRVQGMCLYRRVRHLPARVRAWWHERLAIAERHARSRRP